jgi:hypothetical protein
VRLTNGVFQLTPDGAWRNGGGKNLSAAEVEALASD